MTHSDDTTTHAPGHRLTLQAGGPDSVDLPDARFVSDAAMARDGFDLVLTARDGSEIVVEGYFLSEPPPALHAPNGAVLTPALVDAFIEGPARVAGTQTASDESPVGKVGEVSGHATITHPDGTKEDIVLGMPVREGDIIETDAGGAVNIVFTDGSSFAVSENARMAIDEYVFDAHSDSGASSFSMLRGLFVYTSGLIGREDPDDVKIQTPVGSIGIRGTVIAGNVDTGEITVVEGAIVLRAPSGEEVTLSGQYETARFASQGVTQMPALTAAELGAKFSTIGAVAPAFFSGLDAQAPAARDGGNAPGKTDDGGHQSHQNGETPRGEEHSQAEPAQTAPLPPTPPAPAPDAAILGNSFSTSGGVGEPAAFMASAPVAAEIAPPPQPSASTTTAAAPGTAPAASTTTAAPSTTTTATSSTALTPPPSILAPPPQTAPVSNAPTVSSATFSIMENATQNATVGTVAAASPLAGQTLSYAITGGNAGNIFAINPVTGAITVNGNVDYETAHAYALTVTVTDSQNTPLSGSGTVTIAIGDQNDVTPVLTSGAFSVNENATAGTSVGTVAATDPDTVGTLSYSIVGGNTGNAFAIGPGGQVTVATGAVIDYEALSSYTLNIQVSDGLHTASAAFAITVNDLAEPLSLNTLNTAQGYSIRDDIAERFGGGFAAIGDKNNNGFDDLLAIKDLNQLVFTTAGQPASPGTLSVAGLPSFSPGLTGDTGDMTIAYAGDFNGDGQKDIILGVPHGNDGNGTPVGSGGAYIMGVDGTLIARLDGYNASDLAGSAVSGIGDFNRDGFADVAVGAPGYDAIGTNAGAVHIIYGQDPLQINASIQITAFNTIRAMDSEPLQNPADIKIAGHYSYVVSPTDNSLTIYDIINPNAPLPSATLDSSAILIATSGSVTNALDGASEVAVQGQYVYVASETAGRVTIINAASPGAPAYAGSIAITPLQGVSSLDVRGNLIAAVSSVSDKLVLINASTVASPAVIGTPLSVVDPVKVMFSPTGRYVYVAMSGAIEVIDVGTPAAPVVVQTYTNALFNAVSDMHIDGNTLYVTAAGSDALVLLDITNEGTLTFVNSFTSALLDGASGVTVDHGYALVTAANSNALVVIDVHNPAQILQTNSYSGSATLGASAVAVDGHGNVHVAGATTGAYTIFEASADGMAVNGAAALDLTGTNVSKAGDFNRDGFDDFMLSVPGSSGNGTVHLVFGNDFPGAVTLGTNTLAITNIAVASTDRDIPLAYAGDLNGDGISDIMIGANGGNGGKGLMHIVYGASSYAAGGQVDAAALNGANGFTITTGASAQHIVGGNAVGDFNGDGRDDLVVVLQDPSAHTADIYVVYGGNTAATMTVADLNDPSRAFHMTYTIPAAIASPDTFVFNISGAGDLNGDGFYDFVVGTPGVDSNPSVDSSGDSNAANDADGQAIVVYGHAGGTVAPVADGSSGDANAAAGQIFASAANQMLFGGTAADTLSDNGFSGVGFRGGAGNDTIAVHNGSFLDIDAGAGQDTLGFLQASGTLNFSALGSEKIQRIEKIDMGAAGQTLQLNLGNVFALMESSDTGTLALASTGSTGNTIQIDNEGSGSKTGATAAQIASLLDADGFTAQTSTYDFSFGGHVLSIDKGLVDGGHVNIA